MAVCSKIDSVSDCDFSCNTDGEHIRMKLGQCMQPTILRVLHDGDDSLRDVTLFGVPPLGVQASALHPIRCHKLILAGASKHLYDLFTIDGFIDSHQSEYHLEVVDHESLRSAVECVYKDQFSVLTANAIEAVCNVLIGADYLGMENIAQSCERFLASPERVKPENCIKLWCFARKYGCLRLMHATSTLIVKHLTDMPENPQFLCMQYADCAKLLMSEAMCVADPDQRCLAAIAWLDHDNVNRASVVHDILNMVPLIFGSVSATTIYKAHENEMLREYAPNAVRNLITSMLISSIAYRQISSTAGGCSNFHSKLCNPNWYVLGGQDTEQLFMQYNASQQFWSKLPDLPWKLEGAGVCAVGNRLIVMGGAKNGSTSDEIDEYNVLTSTWKRNIAKLNVARSDFVACSDGQQVFAIGGDNKNYEELNTVEKFVWNSNVVVSVTDMNWKRSYFAAASPTSHTDNNCIFVAGGFKSEGTIEKYDIFTNTWAKVGVLTANRHELTGILSGDDFYLLGGQDPTSDIVLDKVEIFNITTGQTRTSTSNLLHPRYGCCATTLYHGNVICVLGGMGGSGKHLCAVECFDVREGKWSAGSIVRDMPEKAVYFGFAVV